MTTQILITIYSVLIDVMTVSMMDLTPTWDVAQASILGLTVMNLLVEFRTATTLGILPIVCGQT